MSQYGNYHPAYLDYKCGDCRKCVWVNFGQYWCDHHGKPVNRVDDACISIEPTKKARKRRELCNNKL